MNAIAFVILRKVKHYTQQIFSLLFCRNMKNGSHLAAQIQNHENILKMTRNCTYIAVSTCYLQFLNDRTYFMSKKDKMKAWKKWLDVREEGFHHNALDKKDQSFKIKTSTWKECVFGCMNNHTYVISLSSQAK